MLLFGPEAKIVYTAKAWLKPSCNLFTLSVIPLIVTGVFYGIWLLNHYLISDVKIELPDGNIDTKKLTEPDYDAIFGMWCILILTYRIKLFFQVKTIFRIHSFSFTY